MLQDQISDTFTKTLAANSFHKFKMFLGMVDGKQLSSKEGVGDELNSHTNNTRMYLL